jgi:NADH-quinone oxidoreductase subunit C
MSESLTALGAMIAEKLGDAVTAHEVAFGELNLTVTLPGLLPTLAFLKTDPACRFTSMVDITAVDHPERVARFDVVYQFLSMYTNQRIRLRVAVGEADMVPSAIPVYPAANWFEREIFDMFGILFSNHPDLRRILTDYGFRGYPLRKDFPTTGYTEVRYDEAQKRVVYEPVKLVQDYRQFDFMSPWEGAEYILPGDEKKA